MRSSASSSKRRWWLLALLFCFACNTPATIIRRTAERGEIEEALRLYAEHTRSRGASNPDAIAGIAMVVLRTAAASEDARERAAGFSALRGLGQRSRDTLMQLRDARGVVGDRAAALLYDLDGRDGAPPERLLSAASSTDPEVRIAGLSALEGRRDIVGLLAALDALVPDVRRAAAARLARLARGEQGVVQALGQHAVSDPDELVRASSVMALASGGNDAAPMLEQALADRSALVRMAAISAIGAAAPRRAREVLAPLLAGPMSAPSIEAARVLATAGNTEAQGYILSALNSPRSEFRAQAAVATSALGEERSAALAPHIEDADPEVRVRVCGTLARVGAFRERVVRAMRADARSIDALLAVRALQVLAEAEDASSAEPLRGALRSTDANVRRLAVLAWSILAGNAGDVEPLVPLLRDTDRSVRLMAAGELVRIAMR